VFLLLINLQKGARRQLLNPGKAPQEKMGNKTENL